MQTALIGMYLNNEPIAFEEGGVPCWAAWSRWLDRRRAKLRLLVEVAEPNARVEHAFFLERTPY